MTEPSLVDFDDDGHAVPKHETLPDDLVEAARRVRLSCPEQAISLRD
ncbi:ferredoxin [Gordonia terrae]|nr:ferredoxin [Gordonia terrae]UPW08583.1 ferredoxin [Gordonia terrae]